MTFVAIGALRVKGVMCNHYNPFIDAILVIKHNIPLLIEDPDIMEDPNISLIMPPDMVHY